MSYALFVNTVDLNAAIEQEENLNILTRFDCCGPGAMISEINSYLVFKLKL